MSVDKKLLGETSYKRLFIKNIWSGIAWSIGVTIGFALISLLIAFVLGRVGGLPVVGSWIGGFVQMVQDSMVDSAPGVLGQ